MVLRVGGCEFKPQLTQNRHRNADVLVLPILFLVANCYKELPKFVQTAWPRPPKVKQITFLSLLGFVNTVLFHHFFIPFLENSSLLSHDPVLWSGGQQASRCEAVWCNQPMRVSQSSAGSQGPDRLRAAMVCVCAHGRLPYLQCPSGECVWLCPCVVKQMESVCLLAPRPPCEWLNELVAGSQSRPADSPRGRTEPLCVNSVVGPPTIWHTLEKMHTHLEVRSRWLGHRFSR